MSAGPPTPTSPSGSPSGSGRATPPGGTVLELRDLRVRFDLEAGTTRPVDGVSFRVGRGETVGLVGESGAGKSMTALSILGLVPPPGTAEEGSSIRYLPPRGGEEVELVGAPAGRLREIRGDRVAMIFQEPMSSLNPVQRVGAQIDEALRLHLGLRGERARERSVELLREVGIPEPESRYHAYPHELSGGMRQRVMIAMALACEPDVLVADEPTTALDVTIQAQILDLLKALQERHGMAVILVTHDLAVVSEVCDRVLVMYAGRLVEEGPVERVFTRPAHPYTRSLLELIPRGAVGREPRRSLEEAPLLEVRGLETTFPARGRGGRDVRAVAGVDFEVRRGETLALVGESGSGKTTTGRSVLRLVEPTAGSVVFDGVDVRALDEAALRAFRRRAQIVFQDPYGSLNPRLTVRSMLDEVLRVHRLGGDGPGRARRVEELLERVGLDSSMAGRFPHEFSGGQRQRLGIARALAVEPELIVLDEPVSALDVSIQAQIVELLGELQETSELAYLFISHDLSLVESISDRVAVMYEGRIVETGTTRRIWDAPEHPYTRTLLAAIPGRDAPRAEG